jgi:hypothetical protein
VQLQDKKAAEKANEIVETKPTKKTKIKIKVEDGAID